MKLPHDTLAGTLIAGIILTVVLYFLVRLFIKGVAV